MTNTNSTDLIDIVEGAIEAYNAKDFDKYESFFAEDLTFCHHNRSGEINGRQSLVDMFRVFASDLIPDRKLGPAKLVVQDGNVVIRQQTWEGTAAADVPGMVAKGETISLELCSVYTFDGSVVSSYHDFG